MKKLFQFALILSLFGSSLPQAFSEGLVGNGKKSSDSKPAVEKEEVPMSTPKPTPTPKAKPETTTTN